MELPLKINAREKKFVIIGGIAVLFIIIYFMFGLYSDNKQLAFDYSDTRVMILQKQLNKIAESDKLQKQLDDIKRELKNQEKLFLKGNKAPVAAAELQKTLKNISSSLNIDIKLERALSALKSDHYTGIPVEIGFTASTAKLNNLLSRLRQSAFLLVVSEMKVRVTNISKPEGINVTLVVTGFIRKPSDTKTKEAKNAA